MSSDLIPDQIIAVRIPRKQGKIFHGLCPGIRVEMYGAYQFKVNHDRYNRNFHPKVPISSEEKKTWYSNMYRLKIDGRWHMPDGKKYVFFSRHEIASFLLEQKNMEMT